MLNLIFLLPIVIGLAEPQTNPSQVPELQDIQYKELLSHYLEEVGPTPSTTQLPSQQVPELPSSGGVEPEKPNRGFIAVRDTVFRLFTRRNGRRGEIIKLGDGGSIGRTTYNQAIPTRFIVHDWMNEGLSAPTLTIRDAYLDSDDYNVIIVDWEGGAIGAYQTVRDTAPTVGRVLAQFIDFMNSEGQLDLQQVYVVGYGLGAHIAGVAGKNLKTGRLPVIFALDPVYIRLQFTPNFSETLTYSDADYVEVIHTSILTSRLMRPAGHADFYVGYGSNQPGCFLNPVQCSHERAYLYFAESIRSEQGFYGTPCTDFREIVMLRTCRRNVGPVVQMGGKIADRNRIGVYLVRVNPTPPFALGLIGIRN